MELTLLIMTKEQLKRYITNWNVRYPYDKGWREKHKIALFSLEHKQMTLVDIYMERLEDGLYTEAAQRHLDKKKEDEEFGVTPMRDRSYVRGAGNWLSAAEDKMSQAEQDALFDKIKF